MIIAIYFGNLKKARSNTMGLQPHYIAKKEMIEINGQTTTKVEYPICFSMERGVMYA